MDSAIKDIAEGLKRRMEFLIDSGITAVPKKNPLKTAASQAEGRVFFNGPLSGAASFTPCGHNDWKGVLFTVFPLKGAAVLWGAPVSAGAAPGAFLRPESLSQLQKMLEWLAGELGSPAPEVHDPLSFIAASCPRAAAYSDVEAASASVGAIQKGLSGDGIVLLMGELACWAFLGTASVEEARGAVRTCGSWRAVATYSPDELIRDASLKRAAHADLKLLISASRS